MDHNFFSMGLIAIPLIETFDLKTNFSSNYTSFIQVVLAVVILVISILLNMANFPVRAEKMHQCGLLVSTLARKVHRHMNEDSSSIKYDDLVKDYENILQRVENHSRVDYLYAKNNLTSHYNNQWYFPIIAKTQYLFQFLPYIALLGIESIWLFMLIAK
ncbi:SLATT domain-containing protein [Psychrobacter sp. S1-30-MNA-CIBAN-0213]|uniref:SLATT domain-containing protein n=1 Tax=unclassified Psychrobacter TaxID=196806 RepID=UPI00332E78F0